MYQIMLHPYSIFKKNPLSLQDRYFNLSILNKIQDQNNRTLSTIFVSWTESLLYFHYSILHQDRKGVLFTNPSAREGYDTRSIFKWSLTGFEFRVFLLLD